MHFVLFIWSIVHFAERACIFSDSERALFESAHGCVCVRPLQCSVRYVHRVQQHVTASHMTLWRTRDWAALQSLSPSLCYSFLQLAFSGFQHFLLCGTTCGSCISFISLLLRIVVCISSLLLRSWILVFPNPQALSPCWSLQNKLLSWQKHSSCDKSHAVADKAVTMQNAPKILTSGQALLQNTAALPPTIFSKHYSILKNLL